MSSKKTTTSTNTYGWQTPTDTADTIALRNQINTAYDTPDATIPYAFARRREAAKNRFGSPFGANYSPEVREAQKYNDINELDQEQGVANRMDSFNRRQGKTAALAGLSGQTQSRLVQTGGTQVVQTPFNWGGLLSAGAGIMGAI